MSFVTEVLASHHKKQDFICGKEMLDNYLHHQASQDIKRKLAACLVMADESNEIRGYYTLSNNSIPLDTIPESFKKQLPKSYTSIPVTLLGRLAISQKHQGLGLGKILLFDALKRSFYASTNIGSFAIVVDPLDDEARAFYERYGFILLPDSGKMFLAMRTIAPLIDNIS